MSRMWGQQTMAATRRPARALRSLGIDRARREDLNCAHRLPPQTYALGVDLDRHHLEYVVVLVVAGWQRGQIARRQLPRDLQRGELGLELVGDG